mgnify:CR=1 FL=1
MSNVYKEDLQRPVPMGGYCRIVEMRGKEVNAWNRKYNFI